MRTINRDQILEILEKHQTKLKTLRVRKLSLFGSIVRGENKRNGSDLDFVVEFEKKSFDAYMDLKFFLQDLFACKIDLVLSDTIKPQLRERIIEEMVNAA